MRCCGITWGPDSGACAAPRVGLLGAPSCPRSAPSPGAPGPAAPPTRLREPPGARDPPGVRRSAPGRPARARRGGPTGPCRGDQGVRLTDPDRQHACPPVSQADAGGGWIRMPPARSLRRTPPPSAKMSCAGCFAGLPRRRPAPPKVIDPGLFLARQRHFAAAVIIRHSRYAPVSPAAPARRPPTLQRAADPPARRRRPCPRRAAGLSQLAPLAGSRNVRGPGPWSTSDPARPADAATSMGWGIGVLPVGRVNRERPGTARIAPAGRRAALRLATGRPETPDRRGAPAR